MPLQLPGDTGRVETLGMPDVAETEIALEGPTILSDVALDNSTFRNRIFGPVAIVFRVNDDAVIALADDSDDSLSGSVFTKDVAHGSVWLGGWISISMGTFMSQIPPAHECGGATSGLDVVQRAERVQEHARVELALVDARRLQL